MTETDPFKELDEMSSKPASGEVEVPRHLLQALESAHHKLELAQKKFDKDKAAWESAKPASKPHYANMMAGAKIQLEEAQYQTERALKAIENFKEAKQEESSRPEPHVDELFGKRLGEGVWGTDLGDGFG